MIIANFSDWSHGVTKQLNKILQIHLTYYKSYAKVKFTLKLSERNFYKIVHAINVENNIQSTTKNLQIVNNVEYYNFTTFLSPNYAYNKSYAKKKDLVSGEKTFFSNDSNNDYRKGNTIYYTNFFLYFYYVCHN